jgi:hypothetical protein
MRASLAVVSLVMLVGLGSCAWLNWSEDQSEAVCQAHRTRAMALNEKARAVHVPLVLAVDPSLITLQLGSKLPDTLGSVDTGYASEPDIATAYAEKRAIAGQAARIVFDHQDCFATDFVAQASRTVDAPTEVSRVEMPSPAHCSDGWPSTSIRRQGACSHHGGVVPARPWATLIFD